MAKLTTDNNLQKRNGVYKVRRMDVKGRASQWFISKGK
jgi:hypothetical protein